MRSLNRVNNDQSGGGDRIEVLSFIELERWLATTVDFEEATGDMNDVVSVQLGYWWETK